MRANASRMLVILLLGALGLPACSSAPADEQTSTDAAAGPVAPKELEEATRRVFDESVPAALTAPHGGRLVALGANAAHAEVVIIPDTGQVVVYLLDKDGQPGKRVAQPTLMARIETSGRQFDLELRALPEAGEQVGDASRFSAQTEDLIRAGQATVTLKWVLVDGMVFSDNVVQWEA